MTMKVTVKKVPGTTHIVVHIPKHSHYPLEPALVTLRNGKLPTHVLLATTALLNTRARESAGDPVRRRASLSVALLAQSCVALLAQSRRRIELKADDVSSSKEAHRATTGSNSHCLPFQVLYDLVNMFESIAPGLVESPPPLAPNGADKVGSRRGDHKLTPRLWRCTISVFVFQRHTNTVAVPLWSSRSTYYISAPTLPRLPCSPPGAATAVQGPSGAGCDKLRQPSV